LPIESLQEREADDRRTVFELAKEREKVNDMVIHDLGQTAITRWASVGLPREMTASGHKSLAMHSRYVNLQEIT
jgi:hypothetical protein